MKTISFSRLLMELNPTPGENKYDIDVAERWTRTIVGLKDTLVRSYYDVEPLDPGHFYHKHIPPREYQTATHKSRTNTLIQIIDYQRTAIATLSGTPDAITAIHPNQLTAYANLKPLIAACAKLGIEIK